MRALSQAVVALCVRAGRKGYGAMNTPASVRSGLEGKLLVPNIGCSNCQSKDAEIARLTAKLELATKDLNFSVSQLEKLHGEKTNRAMRRAEERALRKTTLPRFAK